MIAFDLTSIIIPCWNEVAYTRQCLAAVIRQTRRPYEIIAIDNGSTDGTHLYLAGVVDGASVPVTVIGNATNRGFPAAVNQGLARARGAYLVLLNNDAVVTDGWLEQLIALADSHETIGMAGPMSNYASPPQLVEHVTYADLDQMHAFAGRWRDEHRGEWFTTAKLSGFCLLMKRAVYDRVGGLDERFGLGFFDDDDLAERARQAGFTLAVARDLFVHHHGSRTFQGQGVDAAALMKANAEVFAAKWGRSHGREVRLEPWGGPRGEEELRPRMTRMGTGGGIEPQINTDKHRWEDDSG
ncbi:glycosyltransferase family 2 protein, partial [Aquisphaera insulae]|uniref:glycosyltransferase family 2 protein n=1 Tax=Aquisphaera insulae TaxID=2712864 RepID=UPI0013EDDC83